MFSLLTQLFPDTKTSSNPNPRSAVEPLSQEMTILDAINVHVRWKHRLNDYVTGKSTEALDPVATSRDNGCPLGQWIHGIGAAQYGDSSSFQELRFHHEEFHRCAGKVIALVQSGRPRDAETLLNGDYARISKIVINGLLRINTEFDAH